MDNHYRLLMETPRTNLSAEMRLLDRVYTHRFLRLHARVGHVFQGRLKAIVVARIMTPRPAPERGFSRRLTPA